MEIGNGQPSIIGLSLRPSIPQIFKGEVIFGQDQVVVESQRPEQVPFDLAAELHLPFDAVAIAYRKAMNEFGFDPTLRLKNLSDQLETYATIMRSKIYKSRSRCFTKKLAS